MCFGAVFLAAGLIFGIRDAWVSARGVNGSIAGGLVIGLITVIPIASVALCVAISRKHSRSHSSALMRAGMVAIAVGFPVARFLTVGAAYCLPHITRLGGIRRPQHPLSNSASFSQPGP